MDDFTDRLADHGGTATEERPTAQRVAAEQACDELLRRIETAASRTPGGVRDAHTDDAPLAALAALVREYARCARAAGMRPEQMVKPLKAALSRFFYDRRERADRLVRLAIRGFFDDAT